MFKKLIAIVSLLVSSFSSAFAGIFYLGPRLAYESNYTTDIRFESFVPVLDAGYRYPLWDIYFVAAEIYAGYRVGIVHSSNNNGISFKNTYMYGIGILPGLVLDPQLLAYMRISAVGTHFVEAGDNTNTWGWQVGLGFETPVTCAWSLRGEVDYGKYEHISGGVPKQYFYSVGAIYRFCC